MTKFFEIDGITLYLGDARDVLPTIRPDVVVTDPPWPDCAHVPIAGSDRANDLFAEVCAVLPSTVRRMCVHVGCNTDPRFLSCVPGRFPFFRVCHLEHAVPGYAGRLLNSGDAAYMFGPPPPSRPGARVIPGRCVADRANKTSPHPCPRRPEHVRWLLRYWVAPGETVVDPFCGTGPVLHAARLSGLRAIGIEIDERWADLTARSLQRDHVLFHAQ